MNRSARSSSQSTQRLSSANKIEQEPQPSTLILSNSQRQYISLSLPKINEMAQEQSIISEKTKEVALPNIHKVKWSIAPRCLMPDHQNLEVLYICIASSCHQATRLACQTCFFNNHSHHNQQFLAIDEIKNASFEKLRYWPFDKRFKQMYEFVVRHENYVSNLVHDINATFDVIGQVIQTMTRNILLELNKLKLELLKEVDTFYLTETNKKKFVDEVQKQLEQCFELRKIRRTVAKLFSKQVKHNVFMMDMERLLNNERVDKAREKLMNYYNNAEKGKDMVFDKNMFMKRESWIVDQVKMQKQTVEVKDVKTFSDLSPQLMIPHSLSYLEMAAKAYGDLTFKSKAYEDGSTYTGFLNGQQKQIMGIRYFKNGTKYLGEWHNNSRNGWGTLINDKTGFRYEGEWREDRRNGYGKEITFTGVYEGQFKNDKKDGFGVCVQGGNRLEIGWKNDKKHGRGRLIKSNGEQIDVYYLNGIEAPNSGGTGKANAVLDLKELSKRFSKKSQSTKD